MVGSLERTTVILRRLPSGRGSATAAAYYLDPVQYIFLNQDVLDSQVVTANSQEIVYSTYSPTLTQTIITNADGLPTVNILWDYHDQPSMNFKFNNNRTLKLEQWIRRSNTRGVLFDINHSGESYEVYQAGDTVIGFRRVNGHAMLAAIRDPYKNVEIVLANKDIADEVLLIAITFSVLVKSKRPLGKDLKNWRGLEF